MRSSNRQQITSHVRISYRFWCWCTELHFSKSRVCCMERNLVPCSMPKFADGQRWYFVSSSRSLKFSSDKWHGRCFRCSISVRAPWWQPLCTSISVFHYKCNHTTPVSTSRSISLSALYGLSYCDRIRTVPWYLIFNRVWSSSIATFAQTRCCESTQLSYLFLWCELLYRSFNL